MMKTARYMLMLLAGSAIVPVMAADNLDAQYGDWKFSLNSNKKMTIEQNDKTLLGGVTMTAKDQNGTELQSDKYADSTNTLPLPTSENRGYNMPFANDNWATFSTVRWSTGQPVTSCEATALFNVDSRQGIVIGSVDHSVWKSSISITPNSTNRIRRLVVNAGYVSPRTWDNGNFGNNSPMQQHGAVKGQRVLSPKFMIGYFDDWRNGLETYGKANTVLCPKLEMKTGDKALFGWQSWGGQEA